MVDFGVGYLNVVYMYKNIFCRTFLESDYGIYIELIVCRKYFDWRGFENDFGGRWGL